MDYKKLRPAARALKKALVALENALAEEIDDDVIAAVRALDDTRADIAAEVPTEGSVEDFLTGIGHSVIEAQKQLDKASSVYLDRLPAHALPASFQIPKVTADLKFAVRSVNQSKVGFIIASRSSEATKQLEQSVHLEIVAVPVPADHPAWKRAPPPQAPAIPPPAAATAPAKVRSIDIDETSIHVELVDADDAPAGLEVYRAPGAPRTRALSATAGGFESLDAPAMRAAAVQKSAPAKVRAAAKKSAKAAGKAAPARARPTAKKGAKAAGKGAPARARAAAKKSAVRTVATRASKR